MANQGLTNLEWLTTKNRDLQKHDDAQNNCPTCHTEHMFCTRNKNRNTNRNYLVLNLHTATPENMIGKILDILVDKRERTIGDSKHMFKENNHHAISTHWYILIYVEFYTLVHERKETLGENSIIGNNHY